MDFTSFHKAVEKALNRPIWTREFNDRGKLLAELLGENNSPTMEEIIDRIPEAKLIITEIPHPAYRRKDEQE